jgi:hypothetical protein
MSEKSPFTNTMMTYLRVARPQHVTILPQINTRKATPAERKIAAATVGDFTASLAQAFAENCQEHRIKRLLYAI